MMDAPVLSLKGISKAFQAVSVLNGVNFEVIPGEVHALVGENGAGKSTLMKIAAGIHQPDSGRIIIGGNEHVLRNTAEALAAGIAMVHQELSLAPDVSVAENIFIGREPRKGLFIDWTKLHRMAADMLSGFCLTVDTSEPVSSLGIGYQQVIEILKALVSEPKVVVFDEPTSSLETQETALVLETVRRLASKGIGVVYISHRIDEIFKVSDKITVLRDGCLVGTWPTRSVDRDTIVNAMVGRELSELFPPKRSEAGKELLRVEDLARKGSFRDISFSIHEGEILGFSGLVGSGRTELMRALFGADPIDSGSVYVNGQLLRISSVRDALDAGIAYLPEERKTLGLFIDRSVEDNIVAASLSRCSNRGVLQQQMLTDIAERYRVRLDVKAASLDQEVSTLSGGNQQKVLLARWMATNPHILIVDEPTRGVDVGAKGEIHRMLRDYASAGNGVIVVSSEMTEILGLCDRIIVMHEGRIAGEVPGVTATEEELIGLAVGHKQMDKSRSL